MNLLLALALLLSPSAVARAKFQPPQATAAVNQTFASDPLTPDGDNAPVLQAFIDSLPAGVTVSLPAGTWPVYTALSVQKNLKFQGAGKDQSILVGRSSAAGHHCVMQLGTYDTVKVSVEIRDIGFRAEYTNVESQQNVVQGHIHDSIIERCSFEGSAHEGLVLRGFSNNVAITDCTASKCGHGNNFYGMPTSGFNCGGVDIVYIRCTAYGCATGWESGGTRIRHTYCAALGCRGGINIGSNGSGVSDVEVDHTTVSSAISGAGGISCGNGIGRLSNVRVHHNKLIGTACSFMGGKPVNNVVMPWEGPDLFGSHFDNNEFYILPQSSAWILGYTTGSSPSQEANEAMAYAGREACSFNGNTFYYLPGAVTNGTPPIEVVGIISAAVEIKDNVIRYSDSAVDRGDVQSFWQYGHALTVTASGNQAFTVAGVARAFVFNLEPPTVLP